MGDGTNWHRYEPCPACKAPTSKPCVDLRTQRAGYNVPYPLTKKHARRRVLRTQSEQGGDRPWLTCDRPSGPPTTRTRPEPDHGLHVIVNLTPHPIHIFPPTCPDRIERDSAESALVLPACVRPPRLGETEAGPVWALDGVPVVDITFGVGEGLPPAQPGVFLVVSRPVAMASRDRSDLLVPHEVVRDLDGSTLGCRAFARPV